MKEIEALNRNFKMILFYIFLVCLILDFDLKQVRVKSDQYRKYLYIRKNHHYFEISVYVPALI